MNGEVEGKFRAASFTLHARKVKNQNLAGLRGLAMVAKFLNRKISNSRNFLPRFISQFIAMNYRLALLPFFCFLFLFSRGQDFSLYQKKIFTSGQDTLRYRLLLPENYKASKKYPRILFLHGAGEKGNDNEKQLVHGAGFFLRDDVRRNYPAIVVFPQCPEKDSWAKYVFMDSGGRQIFQLLKEEGPTTSMRLLELFIQQLDEEFRLDKKRFYVGGLSMGGMGTFDIVRRNPKLFAAAFPICGAADPSTASSLKKPAWWIFHGAKDNVVPPVFSIQMAEALKREKARVRFSLYPNANHNSWDPAFAEQDLMPWLFAQRKK
jgi:predicted peptidase